MNQIFVKCIDCGFGYDKPRLSRCPNCGSINCAADRRVMIIPPKVESNFIGRSRIDSSKAAKEAIQRERAAEARREEYRESRRI